MSYELKNDDVFALARHIGENYLQKGNELTFKYCPYCQGGNSKDKQTFSINIQNGAFNCLRSSCGKQGHFVELARDFNFPLEIEPKKYRKLPQNAEPKKSEKLLKYMNNRHISDTIITKYKLSQSKDNENHICFPFYDENSILQFIKIRNIMHKKGNGSKEWCIKDCKPILFGMSQCSDFTTLVITEGQIDSLSIAECGYKNAVSVPTGALGFTWLKHCYDWILKFERVVVFGDWEKGKMTLLDKLRSNLPMKLYSVQQKYYLGEKDANAILCKYGKQAVCTAINESKIENVNFVKQLSDVENIDIYKMPKILSGIKELDKALGGIYFGQVILLSGKRGEGKSTFMSQLIVETLDQNISVFVYSGELPNFHFKRWLDLQIAGSENIQTLINEYGDETYSLDNKVIEKINNWYRDKAFIFDNSAIDDDEFQGIIKIIINSICRYGIKLICIDNLMTAIDDDSKSDIYRQQSQFVKQLAKIAKQYDVAIILIAHPKKTMGNFDNDTVSGSSDITNAVDVVMNYERSTEENADSKLMITKNRLTGKLLVKENAISLIYSEKSKRIISTKNIQNKVYGCFKTVEKQELRILDYFANFEEIEVEEID